jgi:hypothetical protein
MRRKLGPVASLKRVHIVKRLPKTRSGKILRKTIATIINGQAYTVPATIDDPEILVELETQLRAESVVRH